MRVPEFLVAQDVPFETLVHPPAFTAQKRARFLHLPGREVAKVVLLHGPDGYVLAVVPAIRRVDPARLAEALGGPVRLADDDEIARVFHDCEWGVVPPFGTLYGLPVLLDEGITPDTLMVFETTTHAEAVRMLCRDFERLERPRRLPLAR
ncbi:MAG TPA: YbaK/EbsC family protein [Gemmataceae bacterium]|nr:YbaK/EbsC family protein [Gemmataceae bacterium]